MRVRPVLLIGSTPSRNTPNESRRLLPFLWLTDYVMNECQDNGDWGGNWYARDLMYGFDTLVENVAGERARQGKEAERR